MSKAIHKGAAQHRLLNRLCYFGLLAGLLLLPAPLGSNRAWAWGAFEVYFGVLMMVSCAVRWRTANPLQPSQLVALTALWIAVASVALHSLPAACGPVPGSAALSQLAIVRVCSLAVDPEGQNQFLGQVLLLAMVSSLALLLLDSVRRIRMLLIALIISSSIWAALGTFSSLTGWSWTSEWFRIGTPGRAAGPFVNPNHFAGHLELVLGLGVGLMVSLLRDPQADRSWQQRLRDGLQLVLSGKAALRVLLILLVIGLVTTRSRSGNVAFMVALLFGGLCAVLLIKRPPRSLLLLFASLVIVDLLIVGSWFGLDQIASRVGASVGVAMESEAGQGGFVLNLDAERAEVRSSALRMWQDRPWIGAGGGGFRALYPAFRASGASPSYYDHAHNDFVQILAEQGLLGMGAFLVLVLGALVAGSLALRQRRRRALHGFALGGMIASVSLLIHGIADFNLQIPANMVYFSLALVICWLCGTGLRSERRRQGDSHSADSGELRLVAPVWVAAGGLLFGSAAFGSTLAAVCTGAIAEQPAVVVDLQAPSPIPDALRQQLHADPRNERLREQAGQLAVRWWRYVLELESRGQTAAAAAAVEVLRTRLADTGWRIERANSAGEVSAALAVRARSRVGWSTPQADATACRSLLKQASSIDVLAEYERALCQMRSDPKAALADMQRAAESGHSAAQETMAQLCMRAAKPDPACAMHWLCRASDSRSTAAAAAAFMLLQEPVADLPLVERLYTRAAQAGDAPSANNLGELHERGLLGQIDYRMAERWYRQAADRGLAEAKLNLARLWLERDLENPRARSEALALLRALHAQFPKPVELLLNRFALRLP